MRKGLIIILFSFYGFCDFTFPESGARLQGLGNASIGLPSDIYAIITNPSSLSLITSYKTSFSFVSDKYDFLGITLPEKIKGNLGIAVLSKKDDKAIYFSYGRGIKIKDKPIQKGISIKLFKLENKNGLGLDLGLLYLWRNFTCGFVLANPLSDFGYGFGLSTRFKNILFTQDIKKSKKLTFHFGIEKKISTFFIRGGINDKRLCIGASYFVGGIDMDFSIFPFSFSFTF